MKNLDLKPSVFYKFFLIFSSLLGIILRTFHLFVTGFSVPFDLGGLFYQFTIEILENNFILPSTIPYYYPGGLPFAYPPLPFYVQAIFYKLLSPDNFILINILPPIFSIFSLIAFFFLARKVFSNKMGVTAAFFIFSILPISFTEQIQAMGLAESIGTLFLILYTLSLLLAREDDRTFRWIISGILLAACVASSPGSFYASVVISVLFAGIAVESSISRKDASLIKACLIVGSVGVLVSSPYWLTVVSRHGIHIFSDTFTTYNSSLFYDFRQSVRNLGFLNASRYWNILFIICLIAAIINKNYLLFLYSFIFLPIPRENWVSAPAVSLVIGNGILIFDKIVHTKGKLGKYIEASLLWLLIIFFILDSGFALKALINNDIYDISSHQLEELQDIKGKELIPPGENLIVVGNWGLIEWAPAMLHRVVINNPFGLEWIQNRHEMNVDLSQALLQSTNLEDTMDLVQNNFIRIDRLFIIAHKDHLSQMENSTNVRNISFEILQEYNDLGLGLIISEN